MRVDRHKGRLRVLRGISSEFPLANHFDLSDLEAVFGIPQEVPMCAHVSLIQDGV